ncbi:MAG: oligopeptidase B, partial [Trebonia sp.]
MSNEPPQSPQPPIAKRVPGKRTHHGDTVIDEYAWLTNPKDPETIAYLEAENAYTEALTADLSDLRTAVFDEIKARTQETDLSVPVRKGNWWRYARSVEGQQYSIHCRRRVLPGEVAPPLPEDGKPLDGEEILLDGNEFAAGKEFFKLGTLSVSPDERLLAYSTDFAGNERYTLRIKDLATGEVLPDEVPDTYYGGAWSLDGSTLFYVTVDDAWRPCRVHRHVVGRPASEDVVVFEETDERFWLGVGSTRSDRYVQIRTSSKLTSEVWMLDAADPAGEFTVIAPRREGVEYEVEHAGDRLLILHNDGAENFEIASAPLPGAPGADTWTPLVP